MIVKEIPLAQVIPYARNPRKNDRAIDDVAASIREYGFRQPIVVDEQMVIIVGHTRLEAARKLGLEEVPVHIAAGLSEAQKKAYRLADNRVAQNAEWDRDLLALEMEDLREMGADLAMTGFTDAEINDLFKAPAEGDTDPDSAPQAPTEPVSVKGDVWTLGSHRIMCGDSTFIDDVDRLLHGVKPHLMVTDPPYGVEYDPSWRAEAGVNKNTEKMGHVANDDRADWSDAWALFPGDVAYVWHAGRYSSTVQASLEACGFEIRTQIIWAKERFALSRGNYHWQHEPCWYAVRNKAHWVGDRSQSTLWRISAREDKGLGHGTQKPVECMLRPIYNNSSIGQAVYEPFSGSGTTIIACEQSQRACYAMELNPAYVDVAVRRWQDFTGADAVHENGRTFQEIRDERRPETDADAA